MTFRVVDEQGGTVAEGKDLGALQNRLQGSVRSAISAAVPDIERRGLRDWTIGTLPRTVEHSRGGFVVRAYPAVVDEGDSVAVRLLDTEAEQARAMGRGTRRLLQLVLPSPVTYVSARLTTPAKLALMRNPHGGVVPLLTDCVACAVDRLVAEAGGPAWDADAFARLRDHVRSGLNPASVQVTVEVERILSAAHAVELRLAGLRGPALAPALDDVRRQLSTLVYPGFVAGTGWGRLPDLVRYLRAIDRRLEKLPEHPQRDRDWMLTVHEVQEAYDELPPVPGRDEIRWMIEELRVSFFAQSLGTAYPISDKRIYRAMDQL
jgi:ATP-dependent helicase HrpA